MDTFSCKLYFWAEGQCPPFLCLRCLYADKSKRIPISFWLPTGFFFPFSCHCRPEFIATFVFPRPPFTSSFHRPALPWSGLLLSWCDMVAMICVNCVAFDSDLIWPGQLEPTTTSANNAAVKHLLLFTCWYMQERNFASQHGEVKRS